jgi:hypothetical protein
VSTVVAATAALWALAFGWLTYVMAIRTQNEDEFLAVKSIIEGLRTELALMKDWTGAGGQGYLKATPSPADWSLPNRLIYKFDISAISSLTRSPYLYRLGTIVEPFARLNLSVSRLFQVYDEYRSFVNSDPSIFLQSRVSPQHTDMIRRFNRTMHVDLIGGTDGGPECLYKSYNAAVSALDTFATNLRKRALPWWFLIGHMVGSAFTVLGTMLLVRLLKS